MKVTIFIDEGFCEIAIAHALMNGDKISSFNLFREAIKTYLIVYGEMCLDDHGGETLEFKERAKTIVKKYYKH